MATSDFGTGKSLVVLCIVVGCFAVLWPKIFYPMMQTAFAMTSPSVDTEDPSFQDTDRPPHLHPGSMNPRLRKAMPSDIEDKFHMREGRPFPHPTARNPGKIPHKTGGAMSIIMPIYTIGIVVFFLYTVLKLVFKKPQEEEEEKKPLIKDFHMDPRYRKFMCDESQDKVNKEEPKTKISESFANDILENEAKDIDPKDFEIYQLKKKLEETEEAMGRIMKHMGAMSASLSGMDQKIFPTENESKTGDEVRQRHKKLKKNCESPTSNMNIADLLSDEKRQKLQEDLAQAMHSAAQITKSTSCENANKHIKDDSDTQTDSEQESSESESNDEVEFMPKDGKKNAHNDVCYSDQCCKISPTEKAL